MPITQKAPLLLGEIAEFLATAPSQEQLLKYRPSKGLQQRVRELLAKLKNNRLTAEEQRELDQFECIESLIGLVKARIHASQVSQS